MSRESVASVRVPRPALPADQVLWDLDDDARALYVRLATAGRLPLAEVIEIEAGDVVVELLAQL
ncbi:hypothetical protein [Streptomyces sp. NPDC018352]|uniref:hypothetical protein n=1 Tax=Streptomyces sp. NPDC018352 TaxID=3157194 RepID=UPI0033F9C8D6